MRACVQSPLNMITPLHFYRSLRLNQHPNHQWKLLFGAFILWNNKAMKFYLLMVVNYGEDDMHPVLCP